MAPPARAGHFGSSRIIYFEIEINITLSRRLEAPFEAARNLPGMATDRGQAIALKTGRHPARPVTGYFMDAIDRVNISLTALRITHQFNISSSGFGMIGRSRLRKRRTPS
ncbi:hypothetical protein [Gluconacetobacter tumulisoli]|uniref:Uncharacterized protein n=1 Tax=Gluconacetobacter tumulisoli TaxID=1286189 RepID=A0A7W4K9Z4_9PROT|nr:hypothetical protein [Gluconacetobacter tumulisoli]MBB2203025.1 hypothetical protein [Gluconacetobacter tumulisoli]